MKKTHRRETQCYLEDTRPALVMVIVIVIVIVIVLLTVILILRVP